MHQLNYVVEDQLPKEYIHVASRLVLALARSSAGALSSTLAVEWGWGGLHSSLQGCLGFLTTWRLESKDEHPKRTRHRYLAFL